MKRILSTLLLLAPLTGFPEETLYPVSELVFKYAKERPYQIPLSYLNQIKVALVQTEEGYYSPKELMARPHQLVSLSIQELNQAGLHRYSRQALSEILEATHQFFERQKIRWSYLYIGNDQITLQGQDVRSKDHLVLEISIPTIEAVSVKASKNSYTQNVEKQKARIEKSFPFSLPDPSTGYPGSYIDPEALNNYLYSLNRHPGKRVDLEIGPHTGGVSLDFVITEERPYHIYVSATNNVPEVIHQWQESMGFMHTQLTGRDDILKLNYSTDSFDSFYTASASYEAPVGANPGTRWSVSGNYNRFLSAEFGLSPNLFRGTQGIASGEMIGTIYQRNQFFLEAFGLMEYRHIHNRSHLWHPSIMKNFLFPAIGLKALELKLEHKIIATLQLETTISNWFWEMNHLEALGRRNISSSWALASGSLYWSFYVEPIVTKDVQRMANELVILGQFQNAFNHRLIPQLETVLGGVSTVRGYPQSTVSGDNAYQGSLEYRLHIPQLLTPSPDRKTRWFGKEFRWAPAEPKGRADWDLILRAFYDIGKTTINHRVKGEKNYLIEGIGGGIDFVLWSNLVLKFDWGHALKAANGVDQGNNQSYFSAVLMY